MAAERAHVAHQFDDLGQQREASNLGMWAFLATEVLFFGGMFAVYAVYRTLYYDAFVEGSLYMDVVLGGVNTAVLLLSSYTVVLAVHAVQTGDNKGLVRNLIFTVILGTVFLIIKAFEYEHKFAQNLVPGPGFALTGPDAGHIQIYFLLYFIMTGLHAVHMVVGIGLMAVMAVKASKGRFTREYHNPIEVSGLYWHFVDIVWIFLYPLFYLIQVHP